MEPFVFFAFFYIKIIGAKVQTLYFFSSDFNFKSVSILSLNFFASKILISQTLRFDKNHSYTLSPIYWYVLARLHLAPQPGCIATARLPPPAPPAKPPCILSNRRSRSVALAPTDIHTSFSFTKFSYWGMRHKSFSPRSRWPLLPAVLFGSGANRRVNDTRERKRRAIRFASVFWTAVLHTTQLLFKHCAKKLHF